MIDERAEALSYINGETRINKIHEYRAVYQMARYWIECGEDDYTIRKKIQAWAKAYDHYLTFSIQKCIASARHAKRLRCDNVVYISQADIDEINKRFDQKNSKYVALAVIAYAKVAADKRRIADISMVGLSAWLGIDYTTMTRRIKEMESYSLIRRIDTSNEKRSQRNSVSRFQFLIPIENIGEYQLRGNNIDALANQILS